MTGFLKTLSYTYPDEGPWEIQSGKRVPKFIEVELGYQVIHGEVPSLAFAKFGGNSQKDSQRAFYGINQTQWNESEPAGEEEDWDW